MSEIEDRRERAREAHDEMHGFHPDERFDTALRVATRVKITDEMIERVPATRSDAYDLLCEAFTEAGFEVEQ